MARLKFDNAKRQPDWRYDSGGFDMILPEKFKSRMQDMLGEAYPAFIHSYETISHSALRINTLKGTREQFLDKAIFSGLREVKWEQNGFYYSKQQNSVRAGKHPLHEAGVYYIQEPSAMAPAAYLGAEPQERVLDLCAAPGGKSTQTACYMQNRGILVCNEIHPARAKILSENIERMGIRNALVTNETPQRLAEVFGGYFDRILVDAPCSGEGMFRKNQESVAEWSLENIQLCAERQDEILDCADIMLRAGGRLVYSTCTFAPEENEGSIARFLMRHPNYQVLAVPLYSGMVEGTPQWAWFQNGVLTQQSNPHDIVALEHTIHLFPHLIEGEGHFLAVLQKAGEAMSRIQGIPPKGIQKGIKAKEVKEFFQFQEESLNIDLTEGRDDCLLRFGDQLYLMPPEMPSIKQLKVLRSGLHLGTLKKNRFEPSHALALALYKEEAKHTMELYQGENVAAQAYLNGQVLSFEGEKGWYLITYMGYSIGWGKLSGQIMKNHYPKGLRKSC